MSENAQRSWERFLKPEALRQNLLVAAIFIPSYEIVQERTT